MRVLIMGLPGSGKSTLAKNVVRLLESKQRSVSWLNADEVRARFDDWDFSMEGRMRQAARLRKLAASSTSEFVICDFVAPTEQARELFEPGFLVWMDTLSAGRYADTNKIFVAPSDYDLRIEEMDAPLFAAEVVSRLLSLATDASGGGEELDVGRAPDSDRQAEHSRG